MSVKEAELKILQDEVIALTSWALTWFLGKVIPADLYVNMTVLQIHEEMASTVMSCCPCLIGTKSLFESLELTPKAVSKYFNKVRTGHKFVGPELGNAGITIILEPFSDNWFLAKKKLGQSKG
jgi:hypothetical protein